MLATVFCLLRAPRTSSRSNNRCSLPLCLFLLTQHASQHKKDFLGMLLQQEPYTRLVLVGHSIGAHICLKLMHDRRFPVDRSILLFPTLENLAQQKPYLRPLFLPGVRHVTSLLGHCVHYVPDFIKRAALSSVTDHTIESVLQICNYHFLQNVLEMGRTEFSEVLDLNHDVEIAPLIDRLVFYYGAADPWAPRSHFDVMRARFPDARVFLDQLDIPHAFPVAHSFQTASVVAAQLADMCPFDFYSDLANSIMLTDPRRATMHPAAALCMLVDKHQSAISNLNLNIQSLQGQLRRQEETISILRSTLHQISSTQQISPSVFFPRRDGTGDYVPMAPVESKPLAQTSTSQTSTPQLPLTPLRSASPVSRASSGFSPVSSMVGHDDFDLDREMRETIREAELLQDALLQRQRERDREEEAVSAGSVLQPEPETAAAPVVGDSAPENDIPVRPVEVITETAPAPVEPAAKQKKSKKPK
eukprot:TRINITY_DN5924_c0_g1_i2.p1 TRINITY_DN5924_c0_g1~~TRINITY_DN5924_c0_g1_i2.p1  ORF type:complete len:474 (+),score=81.13 TRINITY_DN5924_c0_g1_i2:373-1794(+)